MKNCFQPFFYFFWYPLKKFQFKSIAAQFFFYLSRPFFHWNKATPFFLHYWYALWAPNRPFEPAYLCSKTSLRSIEPSDVLSEPDERFWTPTKKQFSQNCYKIEKSAPIELSLVLVIPDGSFESFESPVSPFAGLFCALMF